MQMPRSCHRQTATMQVLCDCSAVAYSGVTLSCRVTLAWIVDEDGGGIGMVLRGTGEQGARWESGAVYRDNNVVIALALVLALAVGCAGSGGNEGPSLHSTLREGAAGGEPSSCFITLKCDRPALLRTVF